MDLNHREPEINEIKDQEIIDAPIKKNINDFFDAFEDTIQQAPVIFKRPAEGEICENCSG